MQTEKERWVNEVLKSADGMVRAAAPDLSEGFLTGVSISRHLSSGMAIRDSSFIWRVAASVAILLVLNIASVYTYQSHISKVRNEQQAQAAVVEFGLGQGSDAGSIILGN